MGDGDGIDINGIRGGVSVCVAMDEVEDEEYLDNAMAYFLALKTISSCLLVTPYFDAAWPSIICLIIPVRRTYTFIVSKQHLLHSEPDTHHSKSLAR